MNKLQHNSITPSGAYVSLSELQQLRHLAKQCNTNSQRRSQALLSGQHKSRAVSRGMEFEEVRQYQPGDDIRTIDWRVTARTQVTHTKRYSEEKEKPIITAVDQRRSLFFGSDPCFKSVYACHLAALINWATLHHGDRSGGVVLGSQSIDETRAARSHKTVNRWLQQLTSANQQLNAGSNDETTLSTLLEHVIHRAQTGTHIYIISDFYDMNSVDKRCEKLLFQLSRHQQVTLLWVVDQLEIELPQASSLAVSNGSSSLQLSLHSKTLDEFRQQFTEKAAYLTQLSQQLRIHLQKTQVQTPPINYLHHLFN